jgi:hypothetical protein
MKYRLKHSFLFLSLAISYCGFSANRYWVSASASNWNNTANWSANSNSAGGASVPGTSDIAIFDGAGGNNGTCSIDAAVNVAGFSIAGYSGTITQGANTITIGTSHFSMSSGTFTGGSSAITISGTFTISGGTFTSTTSTLSIGGNWSSSVTIFSHSGGTFNHNNGTLVLNPNGNYCYSQQVFTMDVLTSTAFYNINLNGTHVCGYSAYFATAAGDTIDATNDLTQSDGYITGLFQVENNLIIGSSADGGIGTIIVDGAGAQTYSQSGAAARTCQVKVNKSAGTFIAAGGTTALTTQGFTLQSGSFTAPSGNFTIGGSWSASQTIFTHSGGAFNHNNGTLVLDPNGAYCYSQAVFTLDVLTSTAFYNINLTGTHVCGYSAYFATAAGDTIDATNDFTHTDGYITGLFQVGRNLFIGSSADGGTGSIIVTGTAAQTYSQADPTVRTCGIVVNKSAGTFVAAGGTTALTTQAFTLQSGSFTAPTGNFTIGGSWSASRTLFTHSGGTFNHNNGTLVLDPNGAYCYSQAVFTLDVIPSTSFYDIILNGTHVCGYSAYFATAAGDTVDATNDFTHTNGYITGLFQMERNLIIGSSADGGTGSIIATGMAAQTYSQADPTVRTCGIVVNKSAGTFVAAAGTTALTTQAFTMQSGSFTAPTGNLTVGGPWSASQTLFTHSGGTFNHNNGTLVLDPNGSYCYAQAVFTMDVITSTTFYNINLNGTHVCGYSAYFATAAGDTVDATNDLTHTDGYITGLFQLENNLIIGANSDGGTGTIIAAGTGAQTYSQSGAAARTCHVKVNKSAGTFVAAGGTTNFSVQAFTMQSGSFTAPTGNLTVGGAWGSSQTLFTHSGGTFNHNNGTFVFDPIGNYCYGQVVATIDVLTSTSFYNVNFNGTHACSYSGYITTAANDTIDVTNNMTYTDGLNYGTVEVGGNVTVGPFFDGGTGKLIFKGGSNQNFDLTGATALFDAPIVIKKTANKVILVSPCTLDGAGQTVTFTYGIVTTTNTNYLNIGDNVTVNSASDNSYVEGPVMKTGNDAFTFPVGKNGHYEWCAISAPSLTTDAFRAEFFKADPTVPYGTNRVAGLYILSQNCYWMIDSIAGNSSVSLTLSWNAYNGGTLITSPSDLKIAHWHSSGSIWADEGNGGTTSTGANAGYIISASAVSTFSPFTLASRTPLNPLPIELLSFSAKPNGNVVDVNWSTATEINNDFFTVERSTDMINTEFVTTVKGAGNSSSILNYSTLDKKPLNGTSYYRLKQTDFDGKSKYYNWVAVDFNKNLAFSLFPNPVNSNTGFSINLTGTENGQKVSVLIYDATGREVFSKVITLENNAGMVIPIDLSQSLASGVYIISATSDNSICRQKLIVR